MAGATSRAVLDRRIGAAIQWRARTVDRDSDEASSGAELERQKQYYETLVALSPTAIATVDRDDKVTSWNPAAEELFGYSAAEAVGRNIDDLVAGDERVDLEARAVSRRGGAGERSHLITQRTRKDGSLVDVEVLATPIAVAGEQVGMFAIYHDIRELQRARREAEAATEAKSAFLATMSHEIRTPLNAVIGMSDLLLRTDLDAEQRSFADVIRTSGEALLSVIDDILDFSKIEAGRLELDRQPFDLRGCVEAALELVARPAAEKGLDLAYELRPGTPEAIVGDGARLRQILLNLLNNAVKFTERGEVVLTVEAERLAAPAASPDGGADDRFRLHFAVRDTGIGIPADRVERLFQSFSQVDASTTRRYGGTGLGLAISRRLSELMGGGIRVESRPDEGSTFHLAIAAAAAPCPARAYEQEGLLPLARRRILIVDDNATNRRILHSHAEAWAMVPRGTGDPVEALDWIRRGDRFDVAVLDMQMPELDGVALARAIRELRGVDGPPLVLLTSLGQRDHGADERLFAARLAKPIRPSQLYDVLVGALGASVGDRPAVRAAPAPAPATARPLRILVAEDNPVNRSLALLVLQKLGYRADVVANGREAVEAVTRTPYDVVLMDVQMPEMDGLEAAQTIRERLGAGRPRIVAATASALAEERKRCAAAGMDDYLSKPIHIDQLAAALTRVGVSSGAASEEASDAEARAGVLDPSVLERLRATFGPAATDELVNTFLEEGPRLVAALAAACEGDRPDELRRAAHTLKSNAATFGAGALEDLARSVEALGARGSTDGAHEMLERLASELARVRSSLAAGRSGTR
jgi:PAS domain S-box-containing protein